MKIKQFGLILFLVVALMLALVACGDTPKDDATTEPEATQPGEQTTEPEATEPEITYTISFSDGVAAIEVKEGEAAEEPDEPSKIGYRFDGWFLGE
ncbi:MAG: InlB B-repeat-containing protein, partial [Clostridia bacterium]|nr:InlB B-repeat-containing protein [Clostridia bacterium]